MLPPALVPIVNAALREAGEPVPVRSYEQLKGGYESTSLRIVTRRAVYLLKWHDQSRPDLYLNEARSLEALDRSGVVRVPRVLAAAAASADMPGFLLQEWVVTRPGGWDRKMNARLGAQIALLHRSGASAPGYGSIRHLYSSGASEPDSWQSDWATCFRDQWLRPLVIAAERKGVMTPGLRHGLDRLMERLDEWLGGVEQPALIHGDLWRNNVLCDRKGAPVLIDPIAAYADRGVELVYSEMYGGFAPSFYAAYEEAWPTPPGRAERRELYKLALLLQRAETPAHLGHVAAIVQRFVGI